MTDLPPPTAEVRRLVELIGAEATLALIEAHGGTRIYVPRAPTARIVAMVGDAADALCAAYGGEDIKVPLARAWRVLIYRGRGMSYADIARRVGCTEAGVWRILMTRDRTAVQYDLFG